MATIEAILGYSNEELALMTDEQIAEMLKKEGILEPKSDMIAMNKSAKKKVTKKEDRMAEIEKLLAEDL